MKHILLAVVLTLGLSSGAFAADKKKIDTHHFDVLC